MKFMKILNIPCSKFDATQGYARNTDCEIYDIENPGQNTFKNFTEIFSNFSILIF